MVEKRVYPPIPKYFNTTGPCEEHQHYMVPPLPRVPEAPGIVATGACPFGWSSANLGSFYKGLVKDPRQTFRKLRQTPHTHHPVDDARGNAEAMLAMADLGIAFRWD